jgi:hemerythrin superfamily protein
LKAEHDQLHAELAKATREAGALGEAAREVARLLHAHFLKEEQYAMPPLGLLSTIARGTVTPEMLSILPLTQRLKAELPDMLTEHKEIVAALLRLRDWAREAGRVEYERFADALMAHAQNEEEVLYPAAILVGEYLAIKLRQPEAAEA